MFRALALISAVAISGVFAHEHDESTSVVTLTLPSLAASTIHASIITTISDTTSYAVGCPSSTATDDSQEECFMPPKAISLLQGPGTVSWNMDLGSGLADVACNVTSNIATCAQTFIWASNGTETTPPQTLSTTITDIDQFAVPVTVTAGLDKLVPHETGTASPGASLSTGGSSASSSTSTGGVPRNTQQAVLAGVAALAGGVILL